MVLRSGTLHLSGLAAERLLLGASSGRNVVKCMIISDLRDGRMSSSGCRDLRKKTILVVLYASVGGVESNGSIVSTYRTYSIQKNDEKQKKRERVLQ